MEKKFAFLLMGAGYDPQEHQAAFVNGPKTTAIFTVRNPDEARAKVAALHREGFGAIELCGAFGPDFTRELIELTGGEVAMGYVVHFPDQDPLFSAFFGK